MLTVLLPLAFALPFDATPALEHVGPGLPDGLVPEVERAVRFPGGGRVRVGGRIDGLPLRGDLPVIATDARGGVRRMHGAMPGAVDRRALAVTATAGAARAVEAVRRVGPPGTPAPARPLWWVADGTAHPAWSVAVATQGQPRATWEVIVDRADGRVHALRKTSASADAYIYDPHPIHADPLRVALPGVDLQGPWADARSCAEVGDGTLFDLGVCGRWERQALPDAAGDFLYLPDPGATPDPFAEGQAWVHADRMLAWLDATYDVRLPYGPIDVFVNFPLANAFFGDFDGDGQPDISFGHEPVSGVDFGYDADVVYHELGHAVVALLAPDLPFLQADSVGMDWVSGAANEGIADVFAMVLTGDPDVGEYAGSAFGRRAIRELGELRTCPRGLEGQVHRDGEILGSMAWRLLQHPAVGPDRVADLAIGAIPLWGAEPTWAAIADSFTWTAGDLLDSGVLDAEGHAAVLAALDEAGMTDCERIDPLALDTPRSLYLLSAGLEPPYDHVPGTAQLAIDVPEGAEQLIIEELDLSVGEGLGWSVVGRVGEPVVHDTLSVLGLAIATPATYDWLVDVDRGTVVLGAGGDAPLVPGERLYLSITGRAVGDIDPLAFTQGRVTLQIVDDLPSPRPSASRLQGEPEVVAGCTHVATGVGGAGPMLLGPWLLARRRRGTASPEPR